MKKALILATLLLTLSGCTKRTDYGSCVGVADERNPHLVYKLSVRNTILGCFFVETLFVPIIVLANETFCPVGQK